MNFDDFRPASTGFSSKLRKEFLDCGLDAWTVCAFDSLPSTMDVASALLREQQRREILNRYTSFPGSGDGVAVFGLTQTDGRGREKRVWSSQPGDGVYASFAVRVKRPLGSLSGLSLVIGLGVKRAVEAFGVSARVKWPNDVYAETRDGRWGKIAGVLVDTSGGGNELGICLGIGINLRTPAVSESVGIEEAGDPAEYAQVAASLTAQIAEVSGAFFEKGFDFFRSDIEQSSYERGSMVVVTREGSARRGVAVGINRDGALLLQTEDSVEEVYSGTLRLSEHDDR